MQKGISLSAEQGGLQCLLSVLASLPPSPQTQGGQGLGSPSLKPFLKRRDKSFMYLILPVPVVFLLMAFWLQLTADRQELVSGRGGRCQVRRSCRGTSKEGLLAIHELEGESAAHICESLLLGIHMKSMCSSGCGTISCRSVCRECVSCCGAYLHITMFQHEVH